MTSQSYRLVIYTTGFLLIRSTTTFSKIEELFFFIFLNEPSLLCGISWKPPMSQRSPYRARHKAGRAFHTYENRRPSLLRHKTKETSIEKHYHLVDRNHKKTYILTTSRLDFQTDQTINSATKPSLRSFKYQRVRSHPSSEAVTSQ